MSPSSRLPGFYEHSLEERARLIADWAALNDHERDVLRGALSLNADGADHMIENVVGVHALPLGIGLNFVVNGRDVLVPMAIEEPSVVAGASYMAKLAREGDGFTATTTEPEMIGQIQMLDFDDPAQARKKVLAAKDELLKLADDTDPVIKGLGGGARDIEARALESKVGPMLVVHLIFDTRDAMGANSINTACEALAPVLEDLTGGRAHLRILSNLADRRLATATCRIPVAAFAFGDYDGHEVAQGIVEAYAFAAADPYRAATHNKGIMNGVDAVVIATGNDWRAIEAGAHAYAARSGRYTSLSEWSLEGDHLGGRLEMPMAVGIVGGATRVHPSAQVALKLLGVETARDLAEVIVSVGLAQNLAALRALATEGIQKGHMALHARQLAVAAGATGDQTRLVVDRLLAEGKPRLDRAEEIVRELAKQ